MFALF
jgi:hypothetical protein